MTEPRVRNEAVRVRLDVNDTAGNRLLSAAGARRYAYNWAVAQIVANHEEWKAQEAADVPRTDRVRPLSFFTLVKLWDTTKAEHTPWFGEHSAWTFRYGIRAAAQAHQRFLKGGGKVGFPRFKSRHRDRPRFTVTDGLRLEPGRVRVGKYGWFPVAAPCRQQARLRRLLVRGRARLMNVTVTRHSDGHWYATLCFERTLATPVEARTAPGGVPVGVDVGLKTAAVVADTLGNVVAQLDSSRALRDALRHLQHLQRDFSRTVKGSKNRKKAARRLARAHARVGALRANRLHAFTAGLAREHGVVVVEDLAIANLLANHHLAQAISDQGWGELRRQLGYKTTRHGGTMIAADRFYPSSKTCSECGHVRAKLALSERTYHCPCCGYVADRDVNAARNLAALGEQHQLVLGSRVGDRHPGGPSATPASHACGGGDEPAVTLAGAPGEAGTSQPLVA